MTCHRLYFDGLTCNDSAAVRMLNVPQHIMYNGSGYELKLCIGPRQFQATLSFQEVQ
jgi:hypothetical protein